MTSPSTSNPAPAPTSEPEAAPGLPPASSARLSSSRAIPEGDRTRPATPCLVVLGDSVSQGQHDPDPAGGWCGWAGRLADRLNVPRSRLINVASAGATIHSVVQHQLPQVRHEQPTLVVLGCGMNDALGALDNALFARHLAEVMRWSTAAAVTVAIPVPVPPLLAGSSMSQLRRRLIQGRIETINDELETQSLRFAAVCLSWEFLPANMQADIADPQFWHDDGIHLNGAGHALVAEALASATHDVLPDYATHSTDERTPS